MIIKSFTIVKFKSIEELTIPIRSYGTGKNKSSVAFLVGLNESGKSSILEALSLVSTEFKNIEYADYYHKGVEEGENIQVEIELDISQSYLKGILINHIQVDKDFVSQFTIDSVYKVVHLDEEGNYGSFYWLSTTPDFPYYKYIIFNSTQIGELQKVNDVREDITSENVVEFLKPGQQLLTEDELHKLITKKIEQDFDSKIPKIQLWKPQPEFLINEVVDLDEFKEDTSISVPLRNIFHISGFETESKIKNAVEKALKRPDNKAELQVNLSKSITAYINKIWKEHKINIKVNIDGSDCTVHVEDKDKEHKYFSMKQRSDGFNQFISLILSLSTTNDSKNLENTIILLDEPENHLHPSGVRYMRDEILKIGKSNIVIVATHSHYMVDTSTPERHFIVSKREMSSELYQIDENASMNDDEVLASAFGISLFKELLPENIIVVEGGEDKAVISHCLNILHKDFFYSLKSAGGTSKVYGIASILADEKISAYFILDDDNDGRNEKKNILQNLKGSHDKSHVLTIKDIADEIPEKSTLEDLLPQSFVKKFFEKEMNHEFIFTTDHPIIFQIKNQDESLKQNKEQMNSKKIKLSEEFVEEFDTKLKLQTGAPLLVKLVNNIVDKMRS